MEPAPGGPKGNGDAEDLESQEDMKWAMALDTAEVLAKGWFSNIPSSHKIGILMLQSWRPMQHLLRLSSMK